MSDAARSRARRFYDRISGAYDLLADAAEHEARETGLELLAAAPGERVLEVGFGTGHALLALARAVGPSGSVVGLDISARMTARARERLAAAGCADRTELRVGEAPPLPFADSRFDAAFLSFTLELFPEDVLPSVPTELYRVLAPGGRLAVVAMGIDGVPGPMERTYEWFHRHFPHIVDCRPIDGPSLLLAAGFEVIEVRRLGVWGLAVDAILARRPPDRGGVSDPAPTQQGDHGDEERAAQDRPDDREGRAADRQGEDLR